MCWTCQVGGKFRTSSLRLPFLRFHGLLCPILLYSDLFRRYIDYGESACALFGRYGQCWGFLWSYSQFQTHGVMHVGVEVDELSGAKYHSHSTWDLFETLLSCTILSAIVVLLWNLFSTTASITSFCIFYGFFSSPLIPLTLDIVLRLCPKADSYGTRMLMISVPMALGYLIGSPIAGAILSRGWVSLQLFCARALSVCGVLIILARTQIKKSA